MSRSSAPFFWPEWITHRAGVLAIGLGPSSAILWAIVGGRPVLDPLYVGLSVSLATLLIGSLLPGFKMSRERGQSVIE